MVLCAMKEMQLCGEGVGGVQRHNEGGVVVKKKLVKHFNGETMQ